jgi:hypothetical protein
VDGQGIAMVREPCDEVDGRRAPRRRHDGHRG